MRRSPFDNASDKECKDGRASARSARLGLAQLGSAWLSRFLNRRWHTSHGSPCENRVQIYVEGIRVDLLALKQEA